jgi:acyl-CoA synthetase (NDP forming)
VITVSTGEASLIADQAPRTGIDLPPVPAAARDALLADLPTLGYVGNPLDPWGATEPGLGYQAAFRAFASSGVYDVLALVHDFPYRSLPSEVETALEVIAPLVATTAERPDQKPVIVSLTSGEPTPEILAAADAAGGIPVLRGGPEAFTAIAAVARWEARRERRLAEGPVRPDWPTLAIDRTVLGHDPVFDPSTLGSGATTGGHALSERESLSRLAAAGLPIARFEIASDPAAAAEAAARLGLPVVLKLDVEGLAHKSDIGGVRLGMIDLDAVRTSAAELLGLELPAGSLRRGLLVMRHMAGRELILGARRDPTFGPIVLVGVGGILAEAIDDVAIRLAPVRHA